MKVLHYISLFGLVGLLTGCLTPEEMGYLVPSEPVYATPGAVPVATPVATPVYNTSPAYYATPVSGYSTMTVYDGYHPGYGGPRHPHHREPPHGGRPVVHGGHGGHGGHTVKRICPGRAPNGKAARPEMLPLRVGSNRLVSPSPILPRRNRCPGRICRGRVPNGRVVQSEKAALQERAAPAGRAQYTKGSCRASRLRDC